MSILSYSAGAVRRVFALDVLRHSRSLAVGFPTLVVLIHGIVWRQFNDPAGWPMLVASGIFSAAPMLAILLFRYRRRTLLSDPHRRRNVGFAVRIAFWYTVCLWLFALLVVWVGAQRPTGLVWMGLVATEPLYLYPAMCALERVGLPGATAGASESK